MPNGDDGRGMMAEHRDPRLIVAFLCGKECKVTWLCVNYRGKEGPEPYPLLMPVLYHRTRRPNLRPRLLRGPPQKAGVC